MKRLIREPCSEGVGQEAKGRGEIASSVLRVRPQKARDGVGMRETKSQRVQEMKTAKEQNGQVSNEESNPLPSVASSSQGALAQVRSHMLLQTTMWQVAKTCHFWTTLET